MLSVLVAGFHVRLDCLTTPTPLGRRVGLISQRVWCILTLQLKTLSYYVGAFAMASQRLLRKVFTDELFGYRPIVLTSCVAKIENARLIRHVKAKSFPFPLVLFYR